MTKVWDPNRKHKKTAWQMRPRRAPKKSEAVRKRDCAVGVARVIARSFRTEAQRSAVAFWMRRAAAFAPLSERQLNNMMVMTGRSFLVQQGFIKEDSV